jgi:adenylate kinase family enzyme
MHLLDVIASPDQRERYLAPLAAGEVRSRFAMTDPAPGAGPDPSMLATRADRGDDDPSSPVRRRLQVFHRSTAPIVEYYAQLGILQRIDAARAETATLRPREPTFAFG